MGYSLNMYAGDYGPISDGVRVFQTISALVIASMIFIVIMVFVYLNQTSQPQISTTKPKITIKKSNKNNIPKNNIPKNIEAFTFNNLSHWEI